MHSFTKLVVLAAVAAVSSASAISERAVSKDGCTRVVDTNTVDVGGKAVAFTTFQCDNARPVAAVAATTTPAPTNVCGDTCTTTCNNVAGILPPISQDCDTIGAAISIFAGTTSTFTVAANHLKTLTFGTCSYTFANNGAQTLEYCWADLNSTAIAVGAACFPPVHPFFPSGLCTSYDGTWAVGASHS